MEKGEVLEKEKPAVLSKIKCSVISRHGLFPRLVLENNLPVLLPERISCSGWGVSLGYAFRGSPTIAAISSPISSNGITRDADARLKARTADCGGDTEYRK